MSETGNGNSEFEKTIRIYLKQANEKLNSDLVGTREAIKLIAADKARNFIETTDRGLDKTEREFLRNIIIASMHQSFCYGYGIGKIEGKSDKKICL